MISAGIGQTYDLPSVFSAHSAFAAARRSREVISDRPVVAIAFAACTIALPARLLPCATTCQVWGLVPIAQIGVQHWAVGVTQLTLPTSVEPARKCDCPSKSRRPRCSGVEPSN